MSETAPVYVPCAAGGDAFANLRIDKRGDLVHLLGYADMELTPCDARHLAQILLEMAGESFIPALEHRPDADAASGDQIVDAVRHKYVKRALCGQKKYGQKMTREDLSLKDWLTHHQEELMDATLYTEAEIIRLERMEDADGGAGK